jgi:hypothetical protein
LYFTLFHEIKLYFFHKNIFIFRLYLFMNKSNLTIFFSILFNIQMY